MCLRPFTSWHLLISQPLLCDASIPQTCQAFLRLQTLDLAILSASPSLVPGQLHTVVTTH